MVAFAPSLLIGIMGRCRGLVREAPHARCAPHLGRGQRRRRLRLLHVHVLWYGIIPHQWLTWADNEFNWRPDRILVGPGDVLRPEAEGRLLPLTLNWRNLRDLVAVGIYVVGLGLQIWLWAWWKDRCQGQGRRSCRPPATAARWSRRADPPWPGPTPTRRMPEFRDDYVLQEVDAAWLAKAVKPKQFIHIDQSECIMCEGCVDICPWKCIHMVAADAVDRVASAPSSPASTRATT